MSFYNKSLVLKLVFLSVYDVDVALVVGHFLHVLELGLLQVFVDSIIGERNFLIFVCPRKSMLRIVTHILFVMIIIHSNFEF